jgi:cytosine/adenosine deaminase-related metal-dependent hydrolase
MSAPHRPLVLRHADVLVTMDTHRREIADGALVAVDGVVRWVGPTAELPAADAEAARTGSAEVVDLHGHVLLPGLVNTHHHMFQSLTRALPAAQDAELFGWLGRLYPVWAGLTPEMARVSALTAMAELLLSGCTTSSDHLYLFPNGVRLDDTVEAAREIGLRFHAARGSMSVGRSAGGLPPDGLVEGEAAILADTQRLIERFHDPARHAMLRIVVAPCSPFSVSPTLMRESAALARSHGVRLHTHLAENDHDVAYSRERFGMTPAEYAEDVGWLGPDVWHAHCVKLDEDAPVRRMRDLGVRVGLGVDGSASNDGAHLLGEARQAMLLQRVGHGPAAMTAREALEIATLGGAGVLGRDDIGALAPGMACDAVAFDTRGIAHAGAGHDPVAALVFCTPANAALAVVGGRTVVRGGQLLTLDLPPHLETHRRLARELALAAG